jgi:glycosyltransferase involved in cell wall biosynthesis
MTSFNYSRESYGGTEYMAKKFHQDILPEMPKLNSYLSLIIPGVTPPYNELFNSKKEIIIWLHNVVSQFDKEKVATLKDKRLLDKVKYFVVPSEYHKQITVNALHIDSNKVYVIPNAIDPLKYNANKSNDVVKIIHTSDPERGMDILLSSLSYVNEDFKLEIYNKFNPDLYEFNFKDDRVKFFGYTPKVTVKEAVESSHIHAYPSTYLETFCLSMAEAMSAGLLSVHSKIGAIPEVANNFGIMYDYIDNKIEHSKTFAKHLSQAITIVKDKNYDPTEQIKYINNTYSWQAIKKQWLDFHDLI